MSWEGQIEYVPSEVTGERKSTWELHFVLKDLEHFVKAIYICRQIISEPDRFGTKNGFL